MKTVNSLSGGKTSSYIAANYPADYDVFALVRIEGCKFPDEKIRLEVEDRIQAPFIGTAEDDTIIYTMLDLEQYIGRPITWVTGKTFDEVLSNAGTLPDSLRRYCTTEMKMQPMFEWWRLKINEPATFRIGFRASEQRRAKSVMNRLNENGALEMKAIIGRSKNNKRNRWGEIEWQIPTFPLIQDNVYKDKIEKFWKDKPVRFAWMNNCVGCFNKNPLLIKKMHEKHPNKIEWFASKEQIKHKKDVWKKGDRMYTPYKDIINWASQFDLFDDDFNECDSGHCGL